MILKLGPCQPKAKDLPNSQFPKVGNRCFHEAWYYRKLPDGTMMHRDWLTYSPDINRVFCLHCMLFGKKSKKAWVSDGFCKFQNGSISLMGHETTDAHVEASLKVKMRELTLPLIPSIVEEKKKQVALNREIVGQLIEITKYLGYHSLAFRGHREQWSNINKGNFKDLVELMAKNSPALSIHISNLQISGRKELSFISWQRQNLLINALAQEILVIIKFEILNAKFFSISIDSTFDISKREQVSFVIRYTKEEKVFERLISIKESIFTTGQALFDLFIKVMEYNHLDWKTFLVGQSYDGAASMQGKYNGLQTKIKEVNPQAIFIWCHAHRLDLIITSTVGSCPKAVDLFGNMEKLFTFISCSKKRVSMYRDKQKKLYPNARVKALKKVETTRWMSQAYALTTVLETLDSILETLEDIKSFEGQVDFKTGAECTGLLCFLQSFNFLLTAHIFKRVFDFIEPVSRALQAHNIDILMAIELIKKTEKNIKCLRSSEMFFDIYESVRKFAKDNNFEFELTLPTRRLKRVPRQPGELSNDEQINDPVMAYKVNTYFVIIDKVSSELHKRFNNNSIMIAKDLSLLTIKVISSNMKNKSIPVDAFSSICNNYSKILDKEDIVREYEQLIKSNINLISLDKNVSVVLKALSDESDSSSSNYSVVENESIDDSQSILKTYQIFINKGLLNIFPNLFSVLKIGVTLPISSASPERTFSKLKLIKTRLRSTMIQDRLEDLMIISCESNIKTDTDKIIDNFAMRSSVLTKALTY